MVSRLVAILLLAAATTAGALGAHHFAVIGVHDDSPVDTTVAGLIAIVMFAFLLVLAVRYLLLLGLAAYFQSQRARQPFRPKADRDQCLGSERCAATHSPAARPNGARNRHGCAR